jgi:hypothetical protein
MPTGCQMQHPASNDLNNLPASDCLIFLFFRENPLVSKSFYDLDYIIELSEKRLAEYTALYQKVLERLTNIILVYSALGIFLIPLAQHVIAADMTGTVFYIAFALFAVLLLVSLVYFVRLLLPVEIAYLSPPRRYYDTFKNEIESLRPGNHQIAEDSLKGSYIFELENAIDINSNAFRKKTPFSTTPCCLLYLP